MYKILYVFALLFLTSCSLGGSEIRPLYPPFLPPPPEGGPQEFQQGWRDGCDTGLAQHGTDIYRSAFKFKQDPSLVMNPVYYRAWKDAENFCRTYIFEYSLRSLEVWCTVDGLNDDCGGTDNKASTPYLGGSSDSLGYGVIGGGGVGSVIGGGTDGFLGNSNADDGVFGDW